MSKKRYSLEIGDIVQQTRDGRNRQGVIYKRQVDPNTGIVPWTYFEVLWVTGERSLERADHIKHSDDLKSQFNDLVVLQDLQESVQSGASYD